MIGIKVMPTKEISTDGIIKSYYEIAKSFVEYIKAGTIFKKNDIDYKLLLSKINDNLQTATSLWAKGTFNEAHIIIRSAFETLVLFEYLVEFPNEIKKYKTDSAIAEFHNVFCFYRRELLNEEAIISCYNSLPENIQKEIKFLEKKNGVIVPNFQKLEDFFYNHKYLCQKVHHMIRKLKEAKSLNSKKLNYYRIPLYDMSSQIAHSHRHTIIDTAKKMEDEEMLENMQNFFRYAISILLIVYKTAMDKFEYSPADQFLEKVYAMYDYLGIEVPKSNNY